jgi:putative flippase GtrA
MATVLHNTSLLCIVIADPKMVDTKDVTPPQAPVDISMKDLRLTEPLMGGDLPVRRFMREQATNSESAETINDSYPVQERSEVEETSEASTLMHKPPITCFARLRKGRILKFAGVGVTGVIINTSILYVLSRWAALPLVAASTVAVELAAISNYLLNDTWTFALRSPSLRRFVKFNTAALGGLVLNVLSVWVLTRLELYFLVADLIGIAAAFTVNYAFSVRWVWAREA